jgi:hypothetical protein
MRARRDAPGPGGRPPAGLVTFDGRGFTTVAEWDDAQDAWWDARDAWEAEHPGVVLPERVLGRHPLDVEFLSMHGGMWSRPVPDDGLGVRCREHGLTPGEH